jgi:uncharacterized membrane protein YkoI
MMKRRTKAAIVTAAVVVLGGAGATGVTLAASGDDAEAPITGAALERATAAALAHTGEGRVTDTEVGDEESRYEVEVTLDDGSQVDVQLDERFRVVSTEGDDDDAEDDE